MPLHFKGLNICVLHCIVWYGHTCAGNDPATDLRGVGFLSLLQLLYFVTEPKNQQLARSVYKLSLHHSQARHVSHTSWE